MQDTEQVQAPIELPLSSSHLSTFKNTIQAPQIIQWPFSLPTAPSSYSYPSPQSILHAMSRSLSDGSEQNMYDHAIEAMAEYTIPQLVERSRIDMAVLGTTLASFTILMFDHILTFGDEINYIWGRRPTFISGLFLLNRYFTLITMIFYLVGVTSELLAPVDDVTRNVPLNIHPIEVIMVLSVVSVLIAEIMLILRVFAIYRYNKAPIALLIFIWIAHLIMMVVITMETPEILSYTHISMMHLRPNSHLIFVTPAVVFDTVVGVLLTLALYRRWGQFQDRMPLVGLITRDGILYFSVVFASNISWILIRYFFLTRKDSHSVFRESDLTPLEIWAACITTTMIGRLTLNLRKYNPSSDDDRTLTQLRFQTEVSQPTRSEYLIEDYHTPPEDDTPAVTKLQKDHSLSRGQTHA